MSKILMDGFKIDESLSLVLKTNELLWYDSVNNKLKVGFKDLNYYTNTSNEKILTILTQEESPGINILPVEFTVSTVTS